MSKIKVVILGGGVAGMSAAHELLKKGFEVTIYEKQPVYVGGKARSVDVPNTNTTKPDKYLPGEHGFRFFPGFYNHLFETMKEIPFGNEGKTCLDNLSPTDTVQIFQADDNPITLPLHFPKSLKDVKEIFAAFLEVSDELTKEEVSFFAERVWQLMTSCPERFENEYEQVGWWEFTEADRFSKDYQKLLVDGLTRSLVAAKARLASTRTVGSILLQLIYNMLGIGGHTDSVLNAPTNDAWLYPWLKHLNSLGLIYNHGHLVKSINMKDDKVSSVTIEDKETGTVKTIVSDHFILATPVEVAAQLINEDMIKADASLENIIQLAPNVEWMNGIQFYLNETFDMHRGHTIYSDSSWALTSISQIQFWPNYSLADRYNGKVKGILSVDISDWDSLGDFNNKEAKNCSIEEIKEEVWKQLKQEINVKSKDTLTDDMLEYVYLDSDIQPIINQNMVNKKLIKEDYDKLQKVINKEPLLVNQVNTWTLRPNAFTRIPNLYLASDYVKTNTNLATMEGANEAAKRAVNNILFDTNSKESFCKIYELDNPFFLKLIQSKDQKKWNKGLSWGSV
jgi:uncharacterized protein with NAD-binding domain and iron-sulfur cluster